MLSRPADFFSSIVFNNLVTVLTDRNCKENVPSLDDKVEEFTKTVNDMIDSYFPEKTVRLHCEDRFFMTGKIKELLKNEIELLKKGECLSLNHYKKE